MYKLAFVLLVAYSAALALPSRAKEGIESEAVIPAQPIDIPETPKDTGNLVEEALAGETRAPKLGDIINHATNAIRLTIKDERDAVYQTLKKLFEASGQNLEVNLEAAKTGFDVFLFVPKVGQNFFNSIKNANKKTPE